MDILVEWGIPAAFVGFIFSILLYIFKRDLNKRDAAREAKELAEKQEREEKEKNTEKLMLLILQNTRSTNVLATATAKAVQRIPDAHCNGDMTKALADAAKIQNEEKNFLVDQGIKHIFGD